LEALGDGFEDRDWGVIGVGTTDDPADDCDEDDDETLTENECEEEVAFVVGVFLGEPFE